MLVIFDYILKAGIGVVGEPDNWPPEEACQRIVVALLPEIIIVFNIYLHNQSKNTKNSSLN